MDKDKTVRVRYEVLGRTLTKEEATAVYKRLGEALGLNRPTNPGINPIITPYPGQLGPIWGGLAEHDGRGPG